MTLNFDLCTLIFELKVQSTKSKVKVQTKDTKPMPETVASTVEHIRNELQKVIVGQDDAIEQILIALLAEGHALLEGVPGTAKTLTVKTLARIINADFSRIQFTPDLMPSDITGTNVFNIATSNFQSAAWSNLHRHPAGRRNQSHSTKNAGGVAGSDGRTPGDDRRRSISIARRSLPCWRLKTQSNTKELTHYLKPNSIAFNSRYC